MTLATIGLVLAGGFLGGMARFFLSGIVGGRVGETFPWGTLVVNVSGALVIGFATGWAQTSGGVFASEAIRAFLVVGICGGYTTVSSFSLQTMNLALGGESKRAFANVVASVGLCPISVWIGFECGLLALGASR